MNQTINRDSAQETLDWIDSLPEPKRNTSISDLAAQEEMNRIAEGRWYLSEGPGIAPGH